MAHTHSNGDAVIGARIREARQKLGIAQGALAPDVSHAYLSRVEAGRRSPTMNMLVKIADALQREGAEPMSALYLLTGKHDEPCPVCLRPEPNRRRKRGNRH